MTLEEAYALLGGDVREAAARLGSRALLIKYLRQFPEDGGMAALRAARVAGEEAALWQAAHALRGTSGALGLREVAEAAGQCMAAPEAAWADLERAYDRAVAVIGLVENENTEDAPHGVVFEGLRALLVEDDRLCAEITAAMLAGLGIRAHAAQDSGEAVRLAKRGGFDCVFLDAHMPGTDIVATLKDIHAALPGAPVFVLTAGLCPGEEERLREAGMRACLGKPSDAKEVSGLLVACFPDIKKR